MLKYPNHDAFHRYITELNMIYLGNSALYADDYSTDGFEWLDCHSEEKCVYAFLRRGKKQTLLAVFNFSDKAVNYKLKLDDISSLELLIDSNEPRFGGEYGKTVLPKIKNGTAVFNLTAFSGQVYSV